MFGWRTDIYVFMSSILVLTSYRRARLGRPKEGACTPSITAGFDTTTLPPSWRESVQLSIRDPQDGVVAEMYWSDGIQMDVFLCLHYRRKQAVVVLNMRERLNKPIPNDYCKFRYASAAPVGQCEHISLYTIHRMRYAGWKVVVEWRTHG